MAIYKTMFLVSTLALFFNLQYGVSQSQEASIDEKLTYTLNEFYQGNFDPFFDLLAIDAMKVAPYFATADLSNIPLKQEYEKVDLISKEALSGTATVYCYKISKTTLCFKVRFKDKPKLDIERCVIINLLGEELELRYRISQSYEDPIEPAIAFWQVGCGMPDSKSMNDDFESHSSFGNIEEVINVDSLERRAAQGDVKAMSDLGTYYWPDELFPELTKRNRKQYENALYWYRKAAKKGDLFALSQLESFIDGGIFSAAKVGYSRMELLSRIIELKECDEALIQLAEIYSVGNGVKKNASKAQEYYQRAFDCSTTNAELARYIGAGYMLGFGGLPQDNCKAMHYFKRAMDLGMKSAAANYFRLKESSDCE